MKSPGKSSQQMNSPETETPEIPIDPEVEASLSSEEREADPRSGERGAAARAESEAEVQAGLSTEEMSYLEQLQRLQAEFSNYRRRIQRERALWDARAKGEILAGLLPILDDLGRARASIEGAPDGKDAEGLLMVLSRLDDFLGSTGLEVQKTEPGTPFDPNHHEAFMTGASDEYAEGMILQTLQPGYVYQDLLLRPARVMVSSGPEEPPSDSVEHPSGEPAEPQPYESADSGDAR